jgi:hypothetical protein
MVKGEPRLARPFASGLKSGHLSADGCHQGVEAGRDQDAAFWVIRS